MPGLLVILSSPSGGGKTSVIQELCRHTEIHFEYSVSATTRKPRDGEIHGKDYLFLSGDEFQRQIEKDEFIEWEPVHDYFYGTPRFPIDGWLKQDKIVLLDIDVHGALRVKEKYGQSAVSIFIEPPSMGELIKRLNNRRTDSSTEIRRRLQRVPLEMEKKTQFDYVLVNERLENTVLKVLEIIKNHKH